MLEIKYLLVISDGILEVQKGCIYEAISSSGQCFLTWEVDIIFKRTYVKLVISEEKNLLQTSVF